MLVAYFDDSGTHGNAPVVLYGGFIATERVWADFETAWAAMLRKSTGKNSSSHSLRCWRRGVPRLGTPQVRHVHPRFSANYSRP